MKSKLSYALVVILMSFASSFSQTSTTKPGDKPDFSGKWKLNKTLSTPQKDLEDLVDVKLEISATEKKINVVRTLQFDNDTKVSKLTYYTDNRGEKNPKFRGYGKLKTHTYWYNYLILPIFPVYQLVSEYEITKSANTAHMLLSEEDRPKRQYSQKATETWDLSADGKTLTISTDIGKATDDISILEAEISKTPEAKSYRKVFDKID